MENTDLSGVRMIPLAQLHESPWNPRQYYPDAAMEELTQSMRVHGFKPWMALPVRPRAGGGFELGAGHRRKRAAEAAGISDAPCWVREMSDEEFLDVLNFDNSNHEEVHPLHEAAGWAAWMEKTGKGVLDIAARIGQSKEYVYQRLKYSALIDDARKAFLNGEITAGHAILIARLQSADQKKALKFCKPSGAFPPSVRQLGAFIQRDVHLAIRHAKFNLNDEDLVASAGSCEVCPKRTKNSPDLILDFDPHSDDVDVDECVDPSCFNRKLSAHLVQIKGPGREQHRKSGDRSFSGLR